MNSKTIVWIGILCVGQAIGAVDTPGTRSPIGSPTQVPSAGRTNAIPSQPNVYGYVGNLTMTGNIGGGRHFRGFVPYNSMEYLDTRLIDPGTRAVSSFVRRSYGAQPYYDPGQTVTSMQRTGTSGLSSPTVIPQGRNPAASNQWLASFDLSDLLKVPQQRPLSSSPQSMEAVVDQQIARDLVKKPLTAVEPVKPIQPGMDLTPTPVTPQIPAPLQPFEQTATREDKPLRPSEELTIYQRIRQDLLRSSSIDQTQKETEDPAALPPDEMQPPDKADPYRSSLVTRPEEIIDPADGRRALKNYPDYQHLAQARTADYIAVGERFLKQGQYYKAADAFELACVWDRDNTLLVLARSHALFAAGEYMSSSYYLGQALRDEPKLIDSRIDWAFLLDSRDSFEERLVELSTWQQRSNSPELALLMGYVLYTDDKLTRAKISAEYALDFMPDNPAARILVEAITGALNPEPAGSVGQDNP